MRNFRRKSTLRANDTVVLSRRSSHVPEYWRMIDDSGAYSRGRRLYASAREVELWRLCLCAKNIPHIAAGYGKNMRLFVPPMFEPLARREVAEMAAERGGTAPFAQTRIFSNAHWVFLAFLLLIVWHGLRMRWWSIPVAGLIPGPDYWLDHGHILVSRIKSDGEWWRLGTALTLHADSLHLFGNALFGIPVCVLLARRLGFGLAFLLTIASGVLGNAINVLYRPYYHTSIGFSTALFGAIGILCADLAIREGQFYAQWGSPRTRLRILVPVAVGFALLAMLGTEGDQTDYAAHIFGLFAGFFCGAAAAVYIKHRAIPSPGSQRALTALTLAFLVWCWILAFKA